MTIDEMIAKCQGTAWKRLPYCMFYETRPRIAIRSIDGLCPLQFVTGVLHGNMYGGYRTAAKDLGLPAEAVIMAADESSHMKDFEREIREKFIRHLVERVPLEAPAPAPVPEVETAPEPELVEA